MFKFFSVICIFFFSFLSAGEVSLYNFDGCPGNYLAIKELKVGKVNNPDLLKIGVQIDITELNPSEGRLSIKVLDKKKKITSIDLKVIPDDIASEKTCVKQNVKVDLLGTKQSIQFEVNKDLGQKSYLQVYTNNETSINQSAFTKSCPIKLSPTVSLLVKGEEVPKVTRYCVILKEARENTGIDLKQYNDWKAINRQLMWIGDKLNEKPHPKDEIKVDFQLGLPSFSATKIEQITGELVLAIDQTHQLRIDNSLGKLEHPELTKYGMEIEITKLENNKIELTCTGGDRLLAIAIDPRDQNLKHISESIRYEKNILIYTCKADIFLNKNTGLIFTLIDSSKEIRIPFELKDLDLIKTKKPPICVF